MNFTTTSPSPPPPLHPPQPPPPNKIDSDIEIMFVVLARSGVNFHCCATCMLRANLNSFASHLLTPHIYNKNTISYSNKPQLALNIKYKTSYNILILLPAAFFILLDEFS